MKINPFANVIPFPSAVRGKRTEGDGGSSRQQYDPSQNREDDGNKRRDEPFDPRLIDDAVASFSRDNAAQAQGLSAVVEGSGPGLKIQVRDCNGTVLRQFSGEEFLKLRDATAQGAAGPRGKILDQKL